jgi:hypothetical protein
VEPEQVRRVLEEEAHRYFDLVLPRSRTPPASDMATRVRDQCPYFLSSDKVLLARLDPEKGRVELFAGPSWRRSSAMSRWDRHHRGPACTHGARPAVIEQFTGIALDDPQQAVVPVASAADAGYGRGGFVYATTTPRRSGNRSTSAREQTSAWFTYSLKSPTAPNTGSNPAVSAWSGRYNAAKGRRHDLSHLASRKARRRRIQEHPLAEVDAELSIALAAVDPHRHDRRASVAFRLTVPAVLQVQIHDLHGTAPFQPNSHVPTRRFFKVRRDV